MTREYYDKRWIKRLVTVLPREKQLKCSHQWRARVNPIANWGSICCKCGICARGGRML